MAPVGKGPGRARKRAEVATCKNTAKKAKGRSGCQVCEKLLLARGKVRARRASQQQLARARTIDPSR